MASNRANNRFQVPEVIDPPKTICYTIQIPDEETHIANFLGAIAGLTMARAYHDKPGVKSVDIARVWRKAMMTGQFSNCGVAVGANGCEDYDLKQPFITITPINPYIDPSTVPPGYALPPWTVMPPPPGDPGDRILGYVTDDILVTLLSLPPGSWPTILPPGGLPHIRIEVNGPGVVIVHLLAVPVGGDAYIQLEGDSNPLNAFTVPLTLDLTSLPVQNDVVIDFQQEFKTPGTHIIDVTLIPRFSESAPFVLYGGGFRGVTLCGFPKPCQQQPNEDETMPIHVDCDCKVTIDCPDGSTKQLVTTDMINKPGQPGGGAPQPTPGGGAQCYHAQLRANSVFNVPTTLNTGDTMIINNADGAVSNSHNALWRCPNGSQFFGGKCLPFPQTFFPGDPVNAPNGSLCVEIAGTFYSILPGAPFTVPGGVSNAQATIQVNDQTISGLDGDYTFDVCVTNNQVPAWTHCQNVATDAEDWTNTAIFTSPTFNWVGGTGFEDVTLIFTAAPSNVYHGVTISRTIPATEITNVKFTYDMVVGTPDGGTAGDDAVSVLINGTVHNLLLFSGLTTGTDQVQQWSGDVSGVTIIEIDVFSSYHVGGDNGGTVKLKKIEISGKGTNPFAASTC